MAETPSRFTKERLVRVLEQNVIESGKIAKQLCQSSGSRDILLKSAKRMARSESSMEGTLENLRLIERQLDKGLDQANEVERRCLEKTGILQEKIDKITQ